MHGEPIVIAGSVAPRIRRLANCRLDVRVLLCRRGSCHLSRRSQRNHGHRIELSPPSGVGTQFASIRPTSAICKPPATVLEVSFSGILRRSPQPFSYPCRGARWPACCCDLLPERSFRRLSSLRQSVILSTNLEEAQATSWTDCVSELACRIFPLSPTAW